MSCPVFLQGTQLLMKPGDGGGSVLLERRTEHLEARKCEASALLVKES
jgi:hypothetical protein